MLVYVIVVFLREKSVWPVIFVTMGVLKVQNYYHIIYHYMSYEIDISTILMLGTMKAISFAFSVADGQKTEEELQKYAANISRKNLRRQNAIYKEVKERQIHQIPSFFEYLSY